MTQLARNLTLPRASHMCGAAYDGIKVAEALHCWAKAATASASGAGISASAWNICTVDLRHAPI